MKKCTLLVILFRNTLLIACTCALKCMHTHLAAHLTQPGKEEYKAEIKSLLSLLKKRHRHLQHLTLAFACKQVKPVNTGIRSPCSLQASHFLYSAKCIANKKKLRSAATVHKCKTNEWSSDRPKKINGWTIDGRTHQQFHKRSFNFQITQKGLSWPNPSLYAPQIAYNLLLPRRNWWLENFSKPTLLIQHHCNTFFSAHSTSLRVALARTKHDNDKIIMRGVATAMWWCAGGLGRKIRLIFGRGAYRQL